MVLLTAEQVERIYQVTDRLSIHRDWVVVPLNAAEDGAELMQPDGKILLRPPGGEQFEPWLTGAGGYIAHPLAAYESAPIWTVDPKHTPYRDCVKNMRPSGYAGKLGYASAGAGADFIVANMVAEAISGSKTPKEAMERAQKRAERYYKV